MMDNSVVKESQFKPASFDDKKVIKMTEPQKALILFLKEKSEKQEIINKDTILDFYIDKVKGSETYKEYGTKSHPNPHYNFLITDYDNFKIKKWRDQWNIKEQALTWFKNNLGSCILKGKLLAIPVIDI